MLAVFSETAFCNCEHPRGTIAGGIDWQAEHHQPAGHALREGGDQQVLVAGSTSAKSSTAITPAI